MVNTNTLHVAMFPWFSMGHITPFIRLSNKLAEKGIRVSFLVPTKTLASVNHLNHHPQLIQFIPIAVPQLEGLPQGAETTSDVPMFMFGLLFKAFDLTQDQVRECFLSLKPNIVLFDLAHWLPRYVHSLGAKSIYYSGGSAAAVGYMLDPSRKVGKEEQLDENNLMEPPQGFPSASLVKYHPFEARGARFMFIEFDGEISVFNRFSASISESNAICLKSCTELEAPFIEYLERQHDNKILLLGPYTPEPLDAPLEETWAKWLGGFEKGSVVYCALGSECSLPKEQFQELVLGLEQTGLPFLARLKPPFGAVTVEEALPEGFEDRVRGRGVVHDGWVQQQHILRHPSVGCFVSHVGCGSMWEGLVSSCQLVLLSQSVDQIVNSKLMSEVLKVAVKVERGEEDGLFTKDGVEEAVKLVMDKGSEYGKEVKANYLKLRDVLRTEGLESSYISNFITKLQEMAE